MTPTTGPGVTGTIRGRNPNSLVHKYRNEIAEVIKATLQRWNQTVEQSISPHEGQAPTTLIEALARVRVALHLPELLVAASALSRVAPDVPLILPLVAPKGAIPMHPMAKALSDAQRKDAVGGTTLNGLSSTVSLPTGIQPTQSVLSTTSYVTQNPAVEPKGTKRKVDDDVGPDSPSVDAGTTDQTKKPKQLLDGRSSH